MEEVVRCYKWQKSMCTWKHGEKGDDPNDTDKPRSVQKCNNRAVAMSQEDIIANQPTGQPTGMTIPAEDGRGENGEEFGESFIEPMNGTAGEEGEEGEAGVGEPLESHLAGLHPDDLSVAPGVATAEGMPIERGGLELEGGTAPAPPDEAPDMYKTIDASEDPQEPQMSRPPSELDGSSGNPSARDGLNVKIDFSPLHNESKTGPEGDFFGMIMSTTRVNPYLSNLLQAEAPDGAKKKQGTYMKRKAPTPTIQMTLAAFNLSPGIVEEIEDMQELAKDGKALNPSYNATISAPASPTGAYGAAPSIKKSTRSEPKHLSPRRKAETYKQKRRSPSPTKTIIQYPQVTPKRDRAFNARAWRP
jgi:hypothetical protein